MLGISTADTYFTGDGTAYNLGDTSSGNCNMMSALDFATTDYAALNNDQWNGLQNCGRCAEVTCADSRCADKLKSVVVQILDRCPECKHGDLDLSPSVFKTLTGSHPARYTLKWKFVDCPVAGNVNYCLKGGSNNYWTAIQPTNVATGITSLTINGKATKMLDGAYYYLLDGSGTTVADLSKVAVSMTDLNGVSMMDTVSLTAGSCTTGTNQFPPSGSGRPSKPRTNLPSTMSTPIRVPTTVTRKAPPPTIPTVITPTAIVTTTAPTQDQQKSAVVFNASEAVHVPPHSASANDTTPTAEPDLVSDNSGATYQGSDTAAEGSRSIRQDPSVTTVRHEEQNVYAETTDVSDHSIEQRPSSDEVSKETEASYTTSLPTKGGDGQTRLQQSGVPSVDGEELAEAPDASATRSPAVSPSEWHQPSYGSIQSTRQGSSSEGKDNMSINFEVKLTSQPSHVQVVKEDGVSTTSTVTTSDLTSSDRRTNVAKQSPTIARYEDDVVRQTADSDTIAAPSSSGPVICPV
uniref:Expansin-like EG45 domain-containing protein n=1 Tax=Hyaloperonospora arabidopsidis (strain Emoy2) TaxID=559515 RepID=M4BM09_HYAAE